MTPPCGIEVLDIRIAEVCRKYRVLELSVFGSASRGELRPDSDIDLLVEFQPGAGIGLFEFAQLELDLAALLGRRVDLVSKHGLKPRVRPAVLNDAKLLYAA